jgi:hypothetical protein
MVVYNPQVRGSGAPCGHSKQIRNSSLMRILHWPRRFRLRASSRFPLSPANPLALWLLRGFRAAHRCFPTKLIIVRGGRGGRRWARRARRPQCRRRGSLRSLRRAVQSLAAGGELVNDLGRMQAQPVEIDYVDVGALAGREPAAVVETEEIGGLAGLALNHVFERQAGAAFPVAGLACRSARSHR